MSEIESLMRLRETPSHEKAVVFIHGIGAKDPQVYWKQFVTVLLEDTHAFIRDFDVYVWGYPTHKGPKWLIDFGRSLSNKTLVDATPAIMRLGGLWRSTYQTQFSAYQDIGMVCHSMGGLLVQSWVADVLEEGQSPELDHLRHIAFYSTPHNGSPIAGVAWNDQLEGMTVTGDFVGRTRKRWHDHVVKWRDLQMRSEDRLYNRYIPHLVLSGINDQVVPRNFAEIIGMSCRDIQGNHTTLIQPNGIDDTRYKIWRNDLEKVLSPDIVVSDRSIEEPEQVIGQEHALGNQALNSLDSFDSFSVPISPSPQLADRIDIINISTTRLRKAMKRSFSLPEFRLLCKDLGVAYDDLEGDVLEERMQSLIDHFQRRETYDELLQMVVKLRPNLAKPNA